MTTINTGTLPRRLTPGVKMWFDTHTKNLNPIFSRFFKVETSDKNFEDLISIAGTGLAVVKTEGGTFTTDDIKQGFTSRLVHVTYGKMMAITQDALMDDQYTPKLEALIGQHLARSMAATKEVVSHNLINNGFSTSTSVMYNDPDGVALFSTSHKTAKGLTYQNKLSVDADLSESSLEQMCIDIANMTDDAGIRIGVMPKKLLVPNAEMFNAQRLLGSELRVGTPDNDLNTIRTLGLELITSPYLTDSDSFFLITDVEPGLVMLQRLGIEMDETTDFDTVNRKMRVSEKYSVGYGNPRGIYASQGA